MQVFWTKPITISELKRFPLGIAARFEKNEYGITGDCARETWSKYAVGDKVRLFISFGVIDSIERAA